MKICTNYLLLFLFFYGVIASQTATRIKGIHPSVKLTDKQTLLCERGTKQIPLNKINDEYCDCPEDGADEPGTSACSNGRFYCLNKSFKPKSIFSSQVNDMICDCCDGSDEAIGVCVNTCKAAAEHEGKAQRELLEKYKQGVAIKKQYIEEATTSLQNKAFELENANKEMDQLNAEKTLLEEKRSELAEREERRKQELKPPTPEPTESENNNDNDNNNNNNNNEGADNQEQNVNSGTEQQTNGEEQQERQEHEEQTEQQEDGNMEGGDEEEEEEPQEEVVNQQVQVEEVIDDQLKSIQQGIQKNIPPPLQPLFNFVVTYYFEIIQFFKTNLTRPQPVQKTELEIVTEEIHSMDDKIRDLQHKINDLIKITNMNFGKQKEYYSLYSKCFNVDTVEYTYELCPFNKVTQKSKQGHSSTSLGVWSDDSWNLELTKMTYRRGEKCWGGVIRSTIVELTCGSDNIVSDPQEPNRCEYSLKFETPAACSEEHLQVLLLNNESENDEQYHNYF